MTLVLALTAIIVTIQIVTTIQDIRRYMNDTSR